METLIETDIISQLIKRIGTLMGVLDILQTQIQTIYRLQHGIGNLKLQLKAISYFVEQEFILMQFQHHNLKPCPGCK